MCVTMAEEEQPRKADSDETTSSEDGKEQTLLNGKTLNPSSESTVDAGKDSRSSADRDAVLAKVQTEKRFALIKAWEENEKAKVDNKAHKKISATLSWENTKKADVEAQIKKYEEMIERKKAEYAEKKKNKIVEIHAAAEQKRATVKAKLSEERLKIAETAEKFRASGYVPKKLLGCFNVY